ncbi:diguanylate cyclase domain-containing protein [Alicyclobacillus sp. ALC3]|uniref:diguanylate cyclase domain-containing protein n=1 Tax=Alicyclobacillus sp. ALC3 TaxID=2796143 RepID=UPI0023790206|nr:diguanylate cyclase [Alicyclobacillus sp. ALC3]WDL98883.1 diguanylate cyclase [Alicyclobacillus sp. ALC3]
MSLLYGDSYVEVFKSIIEQNPDAILVLSANGTILEVNQTATDLFGYTEEEVQGRSYQEMTFLGHFQNGVNRCFHETLRGIPTAYHADTLHKNGTPLHLLVKLIPLIVEEKLVGVFAVVKDFTEKKRLEKSLKESEEQYRLIAENMTDLVCVLDLNGVVQYASPSHESILGFTPDVYQGNPVFHMIHPDDISHVQGTFMEMTQTKESNMVEFRHKHRDGHWVWMETKGRPVFDEEGNVLHYQTVTRDITERKLFEEKRGHMAYHDTLTGLPNRRLFKERLEQSIKEAVRHGQKMEVMYMDMDKFKQINDAFGQDAGDEFLQQFAERVQGCLRESDTLARFGGDEFTALLPHIEEEHDALGVANRILASLQTPWQIGEHVFEMTSSIGIAFFPADGTTRHELLKHADQALYEAKESGRKNVKMYASCK